MIKKPLSNLKLFDNSLNKKEAFFGLPENIEFCKSCIISNQRPNSAIEHSHTIKTKKKTINFDKSGVCDACRQAQKKKKINWKEREAQLKELCNKYRRNDGNYDCLIPGSGGKDSFYQAHILKYKYGMNPLTMTWAPNIYTDWGRRNFQKWIHSGFDNYLVTPNGLVTRLLTRLAVEKLFHPFQPFMMGQKSMAPKLATQLNIPLVFYGENEAEYGNPLADNESSKRDWSFFTSEEDKVHIGGVSLEDLKKEYGLKKSDLNIFMPVNPEAIEKNNIEVHYLGYYLNWHPQGAYYYSVENGDFEASPERTAGTYSKYNSIDDKIDDFHFYCYYIKFGIGRATYDASQECRSGDLDREEAQMLVKRYDGEFPERFAEEIFKYLSIDEKKFPDAYKNFEVPTMDRNYFDSLADSFRSPHIWNLENGEWSLRKTAFDV
ncbi:MAG: LPS biosynthesis protein PseA [Flavobacteriaceae bacterium]|nr:LPS biosynthesis protein PseA [Flavobacteriaceae bacterium]|tara:strand:- start:11883 stop:13184 length:1302 start_codon:yes stop_codon:yes gene_type:complete